MPIGPTLELFSGVNGRRSFDTQQMPQQPLVPAEHYPSSQAESEQWCQYQAPVEVDIIGRMPAHGSDIYDLYGSLNADFEGPAMQLLGSCIAAI